MIKTLNFKQMKYIAKINVMPLKNLLDPQGKAVKNTLLNLKYTDISNVRIGKHINVELTAKTKKEAKATVEKICKEVLTNPIMETFTIKIKKN